MITFKQYLSEGRTSTISMKDAQEWMEKNALGYLNAGKMLFRGIDGKVGSSDTFLYADSSAGSPRKSIGGMANFYTLWMSHNPEWKGLPRREHSFITSTQSSDAAVWGRLHFVIPADDAKIGEVGANDMWNKELEPELSLAYFTTSTKHLIEIFGKETPQDYASLASTLKQIPIAKIIERYSDRKDPVSYMISAKLVSYLKSHSSAKTLFDLWKIVFNPKNFEFMDGAHVKGEGEFWIDGKAIFIAISKKLSEEDVDNMISWAEEKAPAFAKQLKLRWDW